MRFLIVLLLLVGSAQADKRGLEIATEVDARNTGWVDFTARMNMTLTDRKGRTTTREIHSKTLEILGDGDKAMSIFKTPRDIKGTAMLTFSHKLEADDQWLYLPALKRVKRISSRNKSGPFMGSEFAFEDLGSQEFEKYEHTFLGEDTLNGIKSLKIKQTPLYRYTGYSKQVVWIDARRYIPLKIAFYDRKGSPLKTLLFKNYQQYLGKFWRAEQMVMNNHQNKKSTVLTWSNYQFKTGLKASDFKSNKLKRLR
jgi:outer membrane lipoprotein-sorting protein